MHCNCAAIDVQLAHDGARARQAPQAQQADQDILPHVLIRQKGLPAAIGSVLPPDKLHLLGSCLAMNFLLSARQVFTHEEEPGARGQYLCCIF